MEIQLFDILIIGAGPSGAACALRLSKSGYKVAVLEKEVSPRTKICGDALGVDVVNQLPMLSEGLLTDFLAFPSKLASHGVKIVAPNGGSLAIPFIYKGAKGNGFICKRIDFDHLLYKHMNVSSNIQVIQNCRVISVQQKNDGILVNTSKGVFKGKVIVGADGVRSIVARNLGKIKLERNHFSAGLRVYYEGVTNFNPDNYIELYFIKEILPSYLWVFPLPNNQANVGLMMLASKVAKKKINLKETLNHLLATHPELKERFKNATPLETIKGHGLPLGSKKRLISGERFLLVGDAAGLIDPFSGEGVGNALRSGRIAAEHLIQCIEQNDYSASFNKKYDAEIYRRMWKEFKLSSRLQTMCKYSFLLNTIVHKANKNKNFFKFVIEVISDIETKKVLTKPSFYYQLFFGNKKMD
ncbi:MAG: geranylgeranyl reductase family protein [Bacteroidetes bacterium]|nr:geranylgeranyl reductase family protein [Bacteroidota bacterium]